MFTLQSQSLPGARRHTCHVAIPLLMPPLGTNIIMTHAAGDHVLVQGFTHYSESARFMSPEP